MIPVVFIADSNYVLPTTVVMASMLLNKNQKTEYEFIIFGVNLKEEDKLLLNKATKGAKISILEFDNKKYSSFVAKTHVSVAALYKFDIANILQNYDKVLYLDGDIIVQDDLSEFFNMDLSKNYVAAVKDAYVLCEKKDAPEIDGYFNSGVMLLNCEQMRKDNMAEKLLEIKTKTPNMLFMDQDVLNIAFKDRVVYADFRYNFAASYFRPQYRKHLMKISGKDMAYVKAIRPAIIHYTGKNPWQYYHRIKANIWRKYFKKSVVADVKLDYKDSWKEKLKKFCFYRREKENGKVEIFWRSKRIFAYWNNKSKYRQLYNRRFENKLTTEEIKYILQVQLANVVGSKPDLDNPKTFGEKIQWLKLYYHNPILTKLADKYRVREYVAEKIGEDYLIPLLGVWDKPEDIDFDKLPEQFVLKVNWGSGQNIIVKDKSKFDSAKAIKKLNKWIKNEQNHYYYAFEWAYKNIKPKIIAEKYMEQIDGQLYDYKLFCFNGNPYCVYVAKDNVQGQVGTGCKISFWDLNWNKLPLLYGKHQPVDCVIEKPSNWKQMIELAKALSKGFPFVRVDLYNIKGKIYFGEFTFYPGAGCNLIKPKEWENKFGEMIKLP